MDDHLAITYILIHVFLIKHSHTKAAQALKRAAKDVVILEDDTEWQGPQLDEIIKKWKVASQKEESPSSSEIDSDSDKSSSSSSSSSNSSLPQNVKSKSKKKHVTQKSSSSLSSNDLDSESKHPLAMTKQLTEKKNIKEIKKVSQNSSSPSVENLESDSTKKLAKTVDNKKKASKISSPSSSSSSSSSSEGSDSDSDRTAPKKIKSKKDADKVKALDDHRPKKAASSSSSSGSDSDDESSDTGSSKPKKKNSTKEKVTSVSDSSRTLSTLDLSSSKSTPDSDPSPGSGANKAVKYENKATAVKKDIPDSKITTAVTKPLVKGKSKKSPATTSSDSSSSSSSESDAKMVEAKIEDVEQVQTAKKRRTDIEGSAIVTATASTVQESESGRRSSRIKGGNGNTGRTVNERFKRVDPTKIDPISDNRYVAKFAPDNDYGKQAHEDLIVTRGAGFRKEKNKKKRGSYRGGEITMQSHSFKFT